MLGLLLCVFIVNLSIPVFLSPYDLILVAERITSQCRRWIGHTMPCFLEEPTCGAFSLDCSPLLIALELVNEAISFFMGKHSLIITTFTVSKGSKDFHCIMLDL